MRGLTVQTACIWPCQAFILSDCYFDPVLVSSFLDFVTFILFPLSAWPLPVYWLFPLHFGITCKYFNILLTAVVSSCSLLSWHLGSGMFGHFSNTWTHEVDTLLCERICDWNSFFFYWMLYIKVIDSINSDSMPEMLKEKVRMLRMEQNLERWNSKWQ